MRKLGRVLRAYRLSAKLTLADMEAIVMIPKLKLEQLENGGYKPTEEELRRIWEYWEIPLSVFEALMFDTSKMPAVKRHVITRMQNSMVRATEKYLLPIK